MDDNVERILPKLEGVVEAVSINSVRWKKVFPHRESPLAHLGGGGVSGKITQSIVWPLIARAAKASAIPIIGSAIWDFEDLSLARGLGVRAVAFGSVFMPYPWRPTKFIEKENGKK